MKAVQSCIYCVHIELYNTNMITGGICSQRSKICSLFAFLQRHYDFNKVAQPRGRSVAMYNGNNNPKRYSSSISIRQSTKFKTSNGSCYRCGCCCPMITPNKSTDRQIERIFVERCKYPIKSATINLKRPLFCLRGFASSSSSTEELTALYSSDDENNVDHKTGSTKELPETTMLSVEEQYTRKTPVEHVLLRPGMYVGPNERLPPSTHWVLEHSPPVLPSMTAPDSDNMHSLPEIMTEVDTVMTTPSSTDILLSSSSTKSDEQQINISQQRKRFVQREYGVVPALIKVFDEILVNASDNRLRHPKSCNRIDVIIDPGSSGIDSADNMNNNTTTQQQREPFIRVCNNGKGIPIHMHATEQIYVPELVFGHLLTGSNFNDDEKRITGGRHGYGAKLANIFSKSFTIETVDSSKRLKYRQTWHNNMGVAEPPIITQITKTNQKDIKDYTSVEFIPDLPRLTGVPLCTTIQDEDYAIMCKRVIDVAGCAAEHLTVTLNSRDVSFNSFLDYCYLYRSESASPLCYHQLNPRWKVAVGLSESGSLESISFVNGMATSRGGTHVNALINQITKYILEILEKTNSELAELISPTLIRRNLFICVDTQIENATFDSQMKEYLTSSPDTFGSSYTIKTKFLKLLVQNEAEGGPGIVEHLLNVAQGQKQANLIKNVGGKKTRRQLLAIPKLEDAHRAGRSDDEICTLILTEGDSAKSLAVAGLEVVGRNYFGVFPLRGKLLNVRDIPAAKLIDNAEIKALLSIIGLSFDCDYESEKDRRDLRYQRVIIMTDQDTDGSHIKGLVINFFRCFWPKLLLPPVDIPSDLARMDPPFLASFVTPLLKATKKGKKKNETIAFYSMSEYNNWRSELNSVELKGWTIKYYKGLGTSTPTEAKEYFIAFVNNLRPYRWKSDSDGDMLDMVFDKSRAADRRDWILDKYDASSQVVVDPVEGNSVSFEDFVNKEMIHYSHADNIRSIPSVIDGLKPSQRKVLFACFKRNLKAEIKVAQLSGYCAEHTAYHHGETSLQATIVGMAQDFVGSNNVNLLVPSGQFGTRLVGGADAASARYIFTYPSPITRYIFPEADDVLLNYCEDDGQRIEPHFYCPIIPLILVNGCQGIGTGWSSSIPPFHPVDVLDYIRAKLNSVSTLPEIRPFARGFTGTIEKRSAGDGYTTCGRAQKINSSTILIDELPLRCWTSKYKDYLLSLQQKGTIKNFFEDHTTTKVSFTLTVKPSHMMKLEKGLTAGLKLETSLLTSNMHAFDSNDVIRKYETPEEIADDFFPVRMKLYEDRKSLMMSEMRYLTLLAQNKEKFIEAVISKKINLLTGKTSKGDIAEKMRSLNFATFQDLYEVRNDNEPFRRRKKLSSDSTSFEGISNEIDDKADDENENRGNYDYLLNMPLSSLTAEKIHALQLEVQIKLKELKDLIATTPADLWHQDLDKLDPHLRRLTSS